LTLWWPGVSQPPDPTSEPSGGRSALGGCAVRYRATPAYMSTDHLVLMRPTDHRTGDDFDVFHNEKLVGRIMLMDLAEGHAWICSIFVEHRKPGRPCKGYAVDRESAMKEFAEAWRGD